MQVLYEGGNDFTALFNVHVRNLDGTARLFRANIIETGTNDRRWTSIRHPISIDGDNHQELNTFGGNVRLSWDSVASPCTR